MDTAEVAYRSFPIRIRCLAIVGTLALLAVPDQLPAADWLKKFFNPGQPPARTTSSAALTELELFTPEAAEPTTLPELYATSSLVDIPRRPGRGPFLNQPARTVINREFRFEYDTPNYLTQMPVSPRDQVGLRMAAISDVVRLGAFIIAKHLPESAPASLPELAERFREVEEFRLQHVWRGEPIKRVVSGVPAIEYEVTGIEQLPDGDVSVLRTCLVLVHQNVVYHLSTISSHVDSHLALAFTQSHFTAFHLPGTPRTPTDDRLQQVPGWAFCPEQFPVAPVDAEGAPLTGWHDTNVSIRSPLGEIITVTTFALPRIRVNREALIYALLKQDSRDLDDVRGSVTELTIDGHRWLEYPPVDPESLFGFSRVLHRICIEPDRAIVVRSILPPGMKLADNQTHLTELLTEHTFRNDASPSLAHLGTYGRWQHAQLLFSLGVFHRDRQQLNLARRYLQAATQLAPSHPVLTASHVELLINAERYGDALALLESPPSELAASDYWQLERAGLLMATGAQQRAITAFEDIFVDETVRNDDGFSAYLLALIQADRIDEAIAAADRYLAAGDSEPVATMKVRLLILAERFELAIASATALKSVDSASPVASNLLIEACRDKDDHAAALAEVQRLRDNGLDNARTWFLKATVEMQQERYADARASLETVLERAPDHPEVLETLEIVNSLLGQSDTTAIRQEIAAVALPDTLQPVAISEAERQGASFWYSLVGEAHAFKADLEHRRTWYGIVHLEDTAAVSEFSTLQFSYQPLGERVFVNRIEVFDRDGTLLARGAIDDYYIQDAAGELATEKKLVNVPVPGLQPGCRLEYVVTSERTSPAEAFPFTDYAFSRSAPVGRSFLHVTGDTADIVVHSSVTEARAPESLTLTVDSPQFLTSEPLQVDQQDAYPFASLGSAGDDWKSLAQHYQERFADRLTIPSEVRELAQFIVTQAGATSKDAVTAAMFSFVQNELTYQGLEFGVRGQIMPPVQQTLRRRYGDCKDHSLLLYQLLRAVDLPASLCLVRTDGPLVRPIPAMDQFDHMIVFIDSGPKGQFLDATSKGAAPDFPVPAGLGQHDALILDGENSRLVRIPDYPAKDTRIFADRLVQLDATGHASVSEVVQITGYSAAVYRSLIRDIDLSERNDFVRDYLTPDKADAKPLSGSIENLTDHSRPLILKATYRINDLLHPVYGQMVGRLPDFLESSMVRYEELDHRQTPFRLAYPSDVVARTRLQLPAGYEVEQFPDNVSSGTAFGGLASRITIADGRFEILSRLTRPTGRYSAEQWPAYARFLSLADDTFSPRLLLREAPVKQVSRETTRTAAGR
ncbi:MAG: DUF3857 domain-containing protein [Planctomycetota bacterium]|jgi:tetratricopeptide (TPR) repeat protein